MADPNGNPGLPPSKEQSPPQEPKIPDKYVKDGKPDLAAFVAGHNELVTKFTAKTEDLRKEIEAGLFKERPESPDKYEVPEIDGLDKEELAASPLLAWWRGQAHAGGLSQAKFDEGIKQYAEAMAPVEVSEDDLKGGLGDNYKTRIAAVDTWAQKTAKSEGEMAAFKRAAQDPDGIKLMERLAGLAGDMSGDLPPSKPETLTADKLRAMQQDPKYWNPAQRDPDFVRQVEEGYKKLYPDAKKSA
jgi:hypothetical protein